MILFMKKKKKTAKPIPMTMTKEWKLDEEASMKERNINPITGISSEGYRGSGMTKDVV